MKDRATRKLRIANTPAKPAQPKTGRRPKGEHRPRGKMATTPNPVRPNSRYRGPKVRLDGHDQERIDRAVAKRERKAKRGW